MFNPFTPYIRYSLLIALGLPFCGSVQAGNLQFIGNNLHAIDVTPEKNTGLDHIYVLYDVNGVSATYEVASSAQAANVKWYRYSNLGGGFAEQISNVSTDGNLSVLNTVEGDMGYIIEDGDQRTYCWIVNYLPHRFALRSITPSEESDCDFTVLNVEGTAGPIHYFTINGQQRVLSREIRVDYDNQEWNEQSGQFDIHTVSKTLESIESHLSITPPVYCSSYFTITGDRFLEDWNWEESQQSPVVEPVAVAVQTKAVQSGRENEGEDSDNKSNEIKGPDTGLGGSAPAEIEFQAFTTQGVIHHEWQLTTDPNFENVEYRFNEQNLTYTFTDEGTFYLRYIGSNSDGSCEAYSETYTVSIGASELRCPNAFSPDGDGVNDEWKVSYRSIIEFDCWIFDRNGHEIIHLDTPSKGWDGKRGGKLVGPGVYYYVIRARGADGKEYKKSGDINIIRHRKFGDQNGSSSAGQ